MSDETAHADVLEWTAQIVSAHASNNTIPPDALPSLIQDVYRALLGLGAQPEVIEKPQPAVPVKKSVFGDYIVCLEDGKKLKMLKRYLRTRYGMSPEEYRTKWGLPADYPLVAPNYAARRSEFAKKIGLGTKPRTSMKPAIGKSARGG
jgi:predicted transcriptional regulator